jgi:hypothetical protein
MNAIVYLPKMESIRKRNFLSLFISVGFKYQLCEDENALVHQLKVYENVECFLFFNEQEISFIQKVIRGKSNISAVLLMESSLATIPSVLDGSDSIEELTGITGIDQEPQDLVTFLNKYNFGKVFGLEYYLRHGTPVTERIIRNRKDKKDATKAITEFVTSMESEPGLSTFSDYGQKIGIALDELLLNAIFSANPRLKIADRALEFQLSEEEDVLARWGFDGVNFALSVTDKFGTLDFRTVLKYVTNSIPLGSFVKRSSGGLGLFSTMTKVNQLIVNVEEHKRTEIVGLIRLEKRLKDFSNIQKSLQFFKSGSS